MHKIPAPKIPESNPNGRKMNCGGGVKVRFDNLRIKNVIKKMFRPKMKR